MTAPKRLFAVEKDGFRHGRRPLARNEALPHIPTLLEQLNYVAEHPVSLAEDTANEEWETPADTADEEGEALN